MGYSQCGKKLMQKRFSSGVLESPSMLKRRKFCNQTCMAAFQTGRFRKPPTAQWSRAQSNKTRKAACENCGSTSRLHVHHIDSNPLNNTPSNLQTLCSVCHMRTHWREWKATTKQPKPCLVCDRPARTNG